MKTFNGLLIFSLLPFIASAQPAGRIVKLVGILGYEVPLAILQVPKTNGGFERTDQFELRADQSEEGVEIQSIDVTNGIVLAMVDGKSRTFAFEAPGGFKMADKPATIRLLDAKLHPLIHFYGEAKGRTVLEHPELEGAGFTLTANPQNKSEAAKAFEQLFASRKIAAIPDGDKFILLVPYAFTNQVTPRSDELAKPGQMLGQLSINFQGVPLAKVLEVYGEYVGHPVNDVEHVPCCNGVFLVQQNPLSKEQICYAMQTIFTWHGIRLTTNKDNTISWQKVP